MFVYELSRYLSIIASVSKSRTAGFSTILPEARISFPGRDLQRHCGGMADDLAAAAGERKLAAAVQHLLQGGAGDLVSDSKRWTEETVSSRDG